MIECQCDYCKAERLVTAFTMTKQILDDELRKARIAFQNQHTGLLRKDLFQRAEFARDHPQWSMCVRCDQLEKRRLGADAAIYVCSACDMNEHA